MLRTIQNIYTDGRATVSGWAAYKRQTGSLPWSSIGIHFLNWAVILSGMAFLLWCSGRYGWSRWQFAGILVLAAVPYGVLWHWAKNKVKINQVRNGRRLAKERKFH
jgi:hypothetical protein